jgi:hypothetical protein
MEPVTVVFEAATIVKVAVVWWFFRIVTAPLLSAVARLGLSDANKSNPGSASPPLLGNR